MKAIGFSGKSGTGKSYMALSVADQNDIKLIIDDGLLISEGKVLAGKSAKKEKYRYASVRRAIFDDPKHAREVSTAIKKSGHDSILIIGTSEKMVNLIAERVGVSPVEKHIHIEDVASEEDILTARTQRTKFGKHVIPVPTVEIKRTFSGYFLDPLTSIKKLADGILEKPNSDERTIIRPKYGYFGDFDISEKVLCQIARHETEHTDGVCEVIRTIYYDNGNTREFRIDVSLNFGTDFKKICKEIQKTIISSVDECTSICVDTVNVNVIKVIHSK